MSMEELANLPLDALESELETLIIQSQMHEEEIETNKQQSYENQLTLTRCKAIEDNYVEEIEFLSNEEDAECKKLAIEIQNYEEKKRQLIHEHNVKVGAVQQEIANVNENIIKNEEELKLLKHIKDNDYSREKSDNNDLEKEILSLSDQVEVIQVQIEQKHAANQVLEHKIQASSNELENLQETLKYTCEELQSSKESVEEFQAEIAILRAEIESKKSKPLDAASRGNSLFAEVHDKKIQLESKYQFMKSHFAELQTEHANLMEQIQELGAENMRLSERCMYQIKEEKRQRNMFEVYNQQIVELKAEYSEKLKVFDEKLKCQSKAVSEEQLKVLIDFYQSNEDRLLKVLGELLKTWEEQGDYAKQLADFNSKLRDLEFEVAQDKAETSKLEAERNSLCIEKNFSAKCECKKIAKCGKLSKLLALTNKKRTLQ